MIDHIGFEVSDLARSTGFYDPIFFALGGRRIVDSDAAVAYGINAPLVWFVTRETAARPAPGYGHVALVAAGRAAVDAGYRAGLINGGRDDGPPGPRPEYGPRYYAAYMLDPDGLRVELVSRR